MALMSIKSRTQRIKRIDTLLTKINKAIGKEAFERYSKLSVQDMIDFEELLKHGYVDMHHGGYLGFTVYGSNVGFEK